MFFRKSLQSSGFGDNDDSYKEEAFNKSSTTYKPRKKNIAPTYTNMAMSMQDAVSNIPASSSQIIYPMEQQQQQNNTYQSDAYAPSPRAKAYDEDVNLLDDYATTPTMPTANTTTTASFVVPTNVAPSPSNSAPVPPPQPMSGAPPPPPASFVPVVNAQGPMLSATTEGFKKKDAGLDDLNLYNDLYVVYVIHL